LARYAAQVGFQLGCFPGNAYPYPPVSPVSLHFQRESLCNDNDRVCGHGWPLYEVVGQLIAAALCTVTKCPHLFYPGAATSSGAEFLAANAFMPADGGG
jgi:hypothetical protein